MIVLTTVLKFLAVRWWKANKLSNADYCVSGLPVTWHVYLKDVLLRVCIFRYYIRITAPNEWHLPATNDNTGIISFDWLVLLGFVILFFTMLLVAFNKPFHYTNRTDTRDNRYPPWSNVLKLMMGLLHKGLIWLTLNNLYLRYYPNKININYTPTITHWLRYSKSLNATRSC